MDKSEFYAEARGDLRGPLDGVRVVEATTTWAGPMAGCILAAGGDALRPVRRFGLSLQCLFQRACQFARRVPSDALLT